MTVQMPGATVHEGSSAGPETLRCVLLDAVQALEENGVPYLLIGGLASALLGRPRCSSDIDLLVKPQDAWRSLEVLRKVGFKTEETNPHWIYKAFRDDALVDVLFKSKGDIYLDDEMLQRAPLREIDGVSVRVMPPEDLLVIKALVHDEETPRHWFDAIGLLTRNPIDWEYLLRRARRGPRRVLSLLSYAASLDLPVPLDVIRRLAELGFELRERTPDP
jgi:predicted nucleotidyltransferase